jgi:hypothetical protein
MSALFLLGAGASHGSGECNPYPPPLGGQLFDELRRRGGIAAQLQPPLSIEFQRNFELGMAMFRQSRDADSTSFLRDMAEYFLQFTPGPRNLLHLLIQIIREGRRRSVIATTNYDMLLETVIDTAGLRFVYCGYPLPGPSLALLKLHGSCHFLPDLGGNVLRNCTFANNFGGNVDAPIRIAQSPEEVRRFLREEDSLAPAIAMYAPGKQVLFSPRFVQDQQRYFAGAAQVASVVYVIGLKVVPDDDHIWGVMSKSAARFEYVGFEPDEFLLWAKDAKRRHVHVLEQSLESALPLIRIQMRH